MPTIKLYTVKVVALYLDLSERRVRQLRDEGVLAEAAPGLFDLKATIRAYIKYLRDRSPDAQQVDLRQEQGLFLRAKRKGEEFDLGVKEGRLHDSGDIKQVFTHMLVNFKSRLNAIPAKAAPLVAKKTDKVDIHNILKGHLDEALLELSDFPTVFNNLVKKDETGDS